MEEILALIDKYIEVSNKFWEEDDVDEDAVMTTDWIKSEWALLDEMETLKKDILRIIDNDKELFNKYLGLGSCLRKEDYEHAEVLKNEILHYGKKS